MKIILSQSRSPYFNLAAEEFLFTSGEGEILLLYVNDATVVVGANQVLRNEVNVNFCRNNNIQIARRMSGGGTVYHDAGNLNYCFIVDKEAGKPALDRDFLMPVIEVLRQLQIVVVKGVRKDLWLPGGFKVSGTASHISKNSVLFHGTLLYDSNLEMLTTALKVTEKDFNLKGIASVPSQVKNIKAFITDSGRAAFEKEKFFDLFTTTMAEYFQTQPEILHPDEVDKIQKIAEDKYQKEEWIYRK